MKTIRGQVMATTGVDSHGDAIPLSVLRDIFESTPDPLILTNSHDPAKPCFARGYNKKFVQLDNGNWAIVADIDVFDPDAFSQFGGMSISYTRGRYTMNRDRHPDIEIGFNPRVFSHEDIAELCRASSDEIQVDGLEIIQKQLNEAIILFIAFASGSIFSGFFKEIGKDAYTKVKSYLLSESKKRGAADSVEPLTCNMSFSIKRRGKTTEILVTIRGEDIEYLDSQGFSELHVLEIINKAIQDVDARRIVLRANRTGPLLTLVHYIDRDENYHSPDTSA